LQCNFSGLPRDEVFSILKTRLSTFLNLALWTLANVIQAATWLCFSFGDCHLATLESLTSSCAEKWEVMLRRPMMLPPTVSQNLANSLTTTSQSCDWGHPPTSSHQLTCSWLKTNENHYILIKALIHQKYILTLNLCSS
jgi:hypothetical protein